MSDAARQLVRVLELAASYNDKGEVWMSDSPEKAEQLRVGWQAEIDGLLGSVDDGTMPPGLVEALRSGAAVRDGSGVYVAEARAWVSGLPMVDRDDERGVRR